MEDCKKFNFLKFPTGRLYQQPILLGTTGKMKFIKSRLGMSQSSKVHRYGSVKWNFQSAIHLSFINAVLN